MLINGNPTKEVQVVKGLQQGDPLAPFLFLIDAEGLIALVNRGVEVGCFTGFRFGDESNISLLQYADDTLLLGEATWEYL